MMAITRSPNSHLPTGGHQSSRKVIPIVDLRRKFGMGLKDLSDRTCIIVVDTAGQGGAIQMGVQVDAVSEVLNIKGPTSKNPLFWRAGRYGLHPRDGQDRPGD